MACSERSPTFFMLCLVSWAEISAASWDAPVLGMGKPASRFILRLQSVDREQMLSHCVVERLMMRKVFGKLFVIVDRLGVAGLAGMDPAAL